MAGTLGLSLCFATMEPPLTPTVPEAASPQPAPGTDGPAQDLRPGRHRGPLAGRLGAGVGALPAPTGQERDVLARHASIAVLRLKPMAVRE